jgi:hypothetical protein
MSKNKKIPFSATDFNLNRDINRAREVRRDDDTFRTPAISIYDVDYAIMYYLKNVIDLQVEQNESMVDVPIVYASAEIWSQIQGRGYLRDKQGKILAPYGVIKRTSMSEDDRFRKLDVNYPVEGSNLLIRPKERNFENIRDQHSKTTNSKFSDEFYISVMPEFYKVEYELVFFSYYIEQMNNIVQNIIPASNFVWGDSYKFRTYVGDITFDNINPSNSERLVKSIIPLTVDARLQSEYELRKSTIRKAYSVKRIVFRTEHSSFDINAVDKFPGEKD